jgi:arsenate reductase-like glutaredoxin family protein
MPNKNDSSKFNITKEFKKYKIPVSNEKMEEFCLPKKFTLQPQQKLLPDLLTSKMSPWTVYPNIRGLLLFHQIGAGKTCTAISIAEEFKKKVNIVVVLPAALIGNFVTELRSECPGNEYLTSDERNKLKNLKPGDSQFEKIIKKSDERIEKYYTIYSYHKFVALIQEEKIKKLNNTLLIIDEVQNMISMNGTFYKSLQKVVDSSDDSLKIILLSATPMFDRPVEIALTLNLLKRDDLLPITKFNQEYMDITTNSKEITYKAINMKDFRSKVKNLISYYRGAPPQAYPQAEFKTVRCNMSDFQYKSYLTSLSTEDKFIRGSFKNADILNMPQNFFLGPRFISNVSFPNKSIGEMGYSSFRGQALQIQNIGEYSIKFFKIYQKINKADGPVFVYSNFKELGGIRCFVKFLEHHGWKNYKSYGEGKKRFALWSGDEPHHFKDEVKFIFNQKSNEDGSKIKIMIGSPSIKEGVSLLRVQQVHMMEPYWNMSRMLQIMGRAVRFCSHKDVPKSKRVVKIYLYLATYPGEKTIDQYIWSLAKKKNKLINQFELALKESAFDCELFYNRNSYPTDETELKCKN